MLTAKEKKELEELKKDPDVILARKVRNQEKSYLYSLRNLKKEGKQLREGVKKSDLRSANVKRSSAENVLCD